MITPVKTYWLTGGLLVWLLLLGFQTSADPRATTHRYLVYLRDKANSPFRTDAANEFLSARSIERRQRQGIAVTSRDLPVNPAYVAQVKAVSGVTYWYSSRWFNAVIISCDEATLAKVQALSCVKQASPLNRPAASTPRPVSYAPAATSAITPGTRAEYGKAYAQAVQLGAVAMHKAGYRGEGLQIAVFDAGFPEVDKIPAFQPLFTEKRLASTFNVVDKTRDVYLRDSHGTSVLSTMAAAQPGFFTGTAPKATYHLLITEDAPTETPVEEMNWLVGAEYADSVGVDIITSSLGYTTFPDYPSASHTYADLNGRTAIASRAAAQAARVGMLVFNSAGNDGNGSWRYIGVPADADSIVAVGAVDSLGRRSSFSSVGPTADGRIKPDLSARGGQAAILRPSGVVALANGTSFACPVLAGMAAGFWQANRNRTAQEIIDLLKRSGTQAANPDNLLGYGIPDFVRAYNLANPTAPLSTAAARRPAALEIFPNPTEADEVLLQLPAEVQGQQVLVRVYDSRGAQVFEQELRAQKTAEHLRTGRLAPGTYNCLINVNNPGSPQYQARFVRL